MGSVEFWIGNEKGKSFFAANSIASAIGEVRSSGFKGRFARTERQESINSDAV